MFRILLGDYDVTLMHDDNPVLGPVFFFLFVFFVYFVLLVVFIAIVIHAYITISEITSKLGQELSLVSYLFAVSLICDRDKARSKLLIHDPTRPDPEVFL